MRRVAQMDSAISSQEIGEWLGSLPPLQFGQIIMNANEIDHLLDSQKKRFQNWSSDIFYFEQFWWENDKKMFSFGFSLKERFYLSRTEIWLFSLTVRRLSAKQHKQVRLLQEPQLKIIKKKS